MSELLSRGTNGSEGYTPEGGALQVATLASWRRFPRVGEVRLAVYLACLVTTVLILSGLAIAFGYTVESLPVVAILAVAALISEKQRVWLRPGTAGDGISASISLVPILFAAVLFGPLSAALVAAVSMLGMFERPYMKWAIYTCTRSIAGLLSGFVATAAYGWPSDRTAGIALGTAIGGLVVECSDAALVGITMKVRGKDPVSAIRTLAPLAFASVLLYAPVVALLAVAYERVSPLTLPLFLAPALAAQRLFGLYQEQRQLADDLVKANVRLERANLSFATALVATLDARDRYTAGHSAAVAIYARDIAERLGLSDERQQLAHLCGLVHDIGKIGLPAGLLEKPGPLTLEERRQMQEHSAIGERILAKVEDYSEIARIVRHHHERWDGQGYPDGLAASEIPLLSRIIAVADAYNAMTSDRPYRDAMPSRVARLRLAQGVESQFDTSVVAAFEAILAGASEAYRLAARDDFTLDQQDPFRADEAVAVVA